MCFAVTKFSSKREREINKHQISVNNEKVRWASSRMAQVSRYGERERERSEPFSLCVKSLEQATGHCPVK